MAAARKTKREWLLLFREIAVNRGGSCTSEQYTNQRTRLEFRCGTGHVFSALPMNVLHHESWCPHCSQNARLTIDDVRNAAAELGCELLSNEYHSVHKPLKFRCSRGHIFTASTTSVRTMKSACLECQKLDLAEFQRLADKIGYRLLSDTYTNNYTPIRLLCDAGHVVTIQPKHLKEGRRCSECAKGNRKHVSYRRLHHYR